MTSGVSCFSVFISSMEERPQNQALVTAFVADIPLWERYSERYSSGFVDCLYTSVINVLISDNSRSTHGEGMDGMDGRYQTRTSKRHLDHHSHGDKQQDVYWDRVSHGILLLLSLPSAWFLYTVLKSVNECLMAYQPVWIIACFDLLQLYFISFRGFYFHLQMYNKQLRRSNWE